MGAQARVTPRFRRLVQQASEAYNRNEADVAINLLEQAYAMNPAPLLLYNIARAHTLAGRLDRAVEYYDRFLAERPEESQARLGREARATAQAQIEARQSAAIAAQSALAVRRTPPVEPSRTRTRWVDRPRALGPGQATLLFGGLAVSALGGVFGGLALAQSAGFEQTADPAQRAGFQDRGTAFAWTANGGLVVGPAMALTGLLWFLAQPTRVAIEEPVAPPREGPAADGSLM